MMGWDRERGAPNPYTIYRSRDAMVFGVCAGLADYFGMERWMVRFFWGFALLILPPPTTLLPIWS